MKKKLMALGLVVLLSGCSVFTTLPVTIENHPVALSAGRSMQGVVRRAAEGRHWTVQDIQPGLARCTLRKHNATLIVDVLYTNTTFSIRYVDSTNMYFKPDSGEISRKYNQWVRNLEKDITVFATR